jgi:hypothetical protein
MQLDVEQGTEKMISGGVGPRQGFEFMGNSEENQCQLKKLESWGQALNFDIAGKLGCRVWTFHRLRVGGGEKNDGKIRR